MRSNIRRDIREEIAGLAQLFNRRDVVVTEAGTEHRIIVDAFETSGPVTEEHERQREKEKKLRESIDRSILESLDFTAMTERFEVVHEAHVRTFRWIFEPNPGDCEWDNFAEWLVHSDGLYWIHGKAGSGKLTLMKYIWMQSLTKEHLSTWAKESKLCIAHFYFWDINSRFF